MKSALRRDIPLLLPMFVLIGMGWVMVFSTAAALSLHRPDASVFHHLQRQMVATAIGGAGIVLLLRVPLETLARFAQPLLMGAVVLMFMVFIPGLGKRAGGATRWIDLGFVSFQPVEMLKLTIVLAYSWVLAQEKPGEKWELKSWGKLASLAAAAMILPIMQRDFGSAILLLCVGFLIIWLAGARIRYLAGFALAGMVAAGAALVSEPYRLKRIQMFLSSWTGGGEAYQTKQALIALGSGQLFGVGPGESVQKLFYLPSAHADFIFAIIGEEFGFIGTITVLFLYVLLLREGLAVARKAGGRFPRLLAAGMTMLIFLQALWHIAVVLVLVPTKGLALPFVSYGGSSLLASMLAMGVILRCSAESAKGAVSAGFAGLGARLAADVGQGRANVQMPGATERAWGGYEGVGS